MIFSRFFQSLTVFSLFLSVLAFPALSADVRPSAPEIATGESQSHAVVGNKIMAVTAHPEATKAAYAILNKGGTAADAAIAAQMVLGLVEPQSSGIGGGGFLLYYDAQKQHLVTLDGRETAPSEAGRHLFQGEDGKPLKFYDAAIGGRAVGTPGLLRMLEKIHEWQGTMPWPNLMAPAIRLAHDGFTVTPRLNKMLAAEAKRFDADTIAQLYFYPDGRYPVSMGSTLRNPHYADSLRVIARDGVQAFYDGALSKEVVEKVQRSSKNPGLLSTEDLKAYKTIEREALCGSYRGYQVCSMAEPSSGGLTLLMIFGMLEHFNLEVLGPKNATSWHIISEVSRLAFADRNKYIADSDFVKTPSTRLLDSDYLKSRADLIDALKPAPKVEAGVPPGWDPKKQQATDTKTKNTGTTHLSIVDKYGNVISMTTSIENAFGSRLMVGGFLLNNQLTDFSFKATNDNGRPIANRVQGGKRPRSSMSPVIIFDPEGRPFMVVGSAGGSRIIGYVLQRIISVIDWNMSLEEAMKAPHILHRGKKLEIESKGLDMAEPLKRIGHPIVVGDMNSGLTAIHFKDDQIIGVADPRREGIALGQ